MLYGAGLDGQRAVSMATAASATSASSSWFGDLTPALATLTALEALTILREGKGRRSGPRLENPLPHGMHALCRLRQLSVTCYHQPMPSLALPALEFMQLDAPLFGSEVSSVNTMVPLLCASNSDSATLAVRRLSCLW